LVDGLWKDLKQMGGECIHKLRSRVSGNEKVNQNEEFSHCTLGIMTAQMTQPITILQIVIPSAERLFLRNAEDSFLQRLLKERS